MSERNPSLLILAAGMGSRYGGLKQADGFGPNGETILDYSVYDAMQAGFKKVIFVIRKSIEEEFRAKVSGKLEDKLDVHYVFQEPNVQIEGLVDLPEREKPWGTGHAVLVAEHVVNEPFCVINADDYYGASAFESMADFLKNHCSPIRYCMIGYELLKTLSDHGVVNRGVCVMNERKMLTDTQERTGVFKNNEGIFYSENGATHPIDTESLVSMNMWGFHPSIFEHSRLHFLDFVKENAANPKAEFFIPLVVNKLINEEKVSVSVIPNGERWYGVTYKQDKPMVETAFSKMTVEGKYPTPLWSNVVV